MTIDAVELTKDLIRCPSVTPEDNGALAVLEATLKPMGFACTRLPFSDPEHPTVDNLYARLGSGGKFLCFAGHTDVVPPGDLKAWTTPPFAPEVRDGYLYGRGTEDMKGAIACFAAAVSEFLQERGGKLDGSIGFIITGDEEGLAVNGTQKMVTWMRDHGEIPTACIVGEPTNPKQIGDMVKIGRRGSMYLHLTVHGKQGHVAYPQLADNPITTLVNILHALKSHVIDSGTEFFLPTNLEATSVDVGNEVKNLIPANASARMSIRFNDLHTAESMTAWVKSVIEKYIPPEKYTLTSPAAWGAFLTPPGDLSTLVSDAVKEATGRTPELSTTGGTSDARFIKDICPVVEFGTTGYTPHMVDERVKVDDLYLLKNCYLAVLRRFFG